jgi:hypothetical protein
MWCLTLQALVRRTAPHLVIPVAQEATDDPSLDPSQATTTRDVSATSDADEVGAMPAITAESIANTLTRNEIARLAFPAVLAGVVTLFVPRRPRAKAGSSGGFDPKALSEATGRPVLGMLFPQTGFVRHPRPSRTAPLLCWAVLLSEISLCAAILTTVASVVRQPEFFRQLQADPFRGYAQAVLSMADQVSQFHALDPDQEPGNPETR